MSVSGIPGSDVLTAAQPPTTVPGFDVLNPGTAAAAPAGDTYTPSSSTSLTPGTSTSLAPSTSTSLTPSTSTSLTPSTSTTATPATGTVSSLSSDGIPGYSALFQSVAPAPAAVTVSASQNPYILAYQQTIAASDEELEAGLGTDYAASTSGASSTNALSGVNSILSTLGQGYADDLFQGTGGSIDTTS